MNKHVAVIDLGSNTFHLLIRGIDAKGEGFDLFSKQTHVGLGKNGCGSQMISEEAYAAGLRCIRCYKEIIDELQVDNIVAFGTAAIRDSGNGKDFVKDASQILKHEIEIIDGEREALLIFKGVEKAVKLNSKPYLILDIGGGSIEMVLGNMKKVSWYKSYPLGGLRLAEKFHRQDPITKAEIQSLKAFLKDELAETAKVIRKHKPKRLIGAAGCFETLSQMEHKLFLGKELSEFDTTAKIDIANFTELSELIVKSTKAELLQLPGMHKFRADLLPVSVLLIETLLEMGAFSELVFSDYAMKEGIFFEYAAGAIE